MVVVAAALFTLQLIQLPQLLTALRLETVAPALITSLMAITALEELTAATLFLAQLPQPAEVVVAPTLPA